MTDIKPSKVALSLTMSADELDWLAHAARLSHLSLREFVKRAINRELRHMGVDAVLLKERSRP